MRILVTGAAGFVGRHLCRELADHGYEVIKTDREKAEPGSAWLHALWGFDLGGPGHVEELMEWAKPNYVVHLAARYGRILCRDEPYLAVQDNTASTTELAAVCAERGIPVLYASSSEVYGDHGTEWIYETSELRMPTTIYGLSKRWGEEVLSLYLPPEKLCIVRLNMLFGEGQLGGYGRCSLATFVQSAVNGEPYTVHRNASRSWLHISDAVRGLRLFIDGGHTGVFNLGNPAPPVWMTTVAELVGGEYEVEDVPPGQISHKNYDCSKALRTIDWHSEVSLADGITRTREWAESERCVVA